MFTTPKIRGVDRPPITVSIGDLLAHMNADSLAAGGAGGIKLSAASVTCEVEDSSDLQFVDPTPNARLIGTTGLNDTAGRATQSFSGGVEGIDYILFFYLTLSTGQAMTVEVRVPVRRYL